MELIGPSDLKAGEEPAVRFLERSNHWNGSNNSNGLRYRLAARPKTAVSTLGDVLSNVTAAYRWEKSVEDGIPPKRHINFELAVNCSLNC